MFVDGVKVATVDCFRTTDSARRVLFRADLSAGQHTISIKVSGTKNASSTSNNVDVDAFVTVR